MRINELAVHKGAYGRPEISLKRSKWFYGDKVDDLDDVYYIFSKLLDMNKLSEEYCYVLALDYAKKPLGVYEVGHGDLYSCNVSTNSLFRFLLLTGAQAFFVAHNHVANQLKASDGDKGLSLRISLVAKLMEIDFCGHMIITPKTYIMDETVQEYDAFVADEYEEEEE